MRALADTRRRKSSVYCWTVSPSVATFLWIGAILFGAGISVSPGETPTSQIVAVITSDWTATRGELNTFEIVDGRWVRGAISRVSVTVGRNGLGWGVGMFPATFEGPEKNEGDKRAPAGIFRIESAFGTMERPGLRIPYRKTTPSDFWVDDPASRFYNQWVNTSGNGKGAVAWNSAETLLRKDGLYELAIVVGHNRDPIKPGRGSAIFMHRWSRPGGATIGCTAMAPEDLLRLARWLDVERAPILFQVPGKFIRRLNVPEPVKEALAQ